MFQLHTLNLQAKYTTGKCTKCRERGCKSRENIVYNNNNGRVRSRNMSDGRSRAVHVRLPSHVTISKIRCSGYTCSIFEQNIRLESALNAENVTVSLPRISFTTTTMAAFVVATCLAVDRGRSAIWRCTVLAGDCGRSGAKWVNACTPARFAISLSLSLSLKYTQKQVHTRAHTHTASFSLSLSSHVLRKKANTRVLMADIPDLV